MSRLHFWLSRPVLGFCLLMSALAPTFVGAAESGVSADEATAVANAYATALKDGNIDELRNLTGGALLVKRSRLWTIPDYSQTLQDTFGNSTFVVEGVSSIDEGATQVQLGVQSSDGSVKRVLTVARLAGGLRVVDERVEAE